MLTKKALVDQSGNVLDVRPIGLEYPSIHQWVPCPPETTTDWRYENGALIAPPAAEPPAQQPPARSKQDELAAKVDLALAAISVLLGQPAVVKDEEGKDIELKTSADVLVKLTAEREKPSGQSKTPPANETP